MQQDVTTIIVMTPPVDGASSIDDMLELEGSTSEAVQHFRRHWLGGRWSGHGYAGRTILAKAGYTMPDGSVFFPFAAGRVL